MTGKWLIVFKELIVEVESMRDGQKFAEALHELINQHAVEGRGNFEFDFEENPYKK